MAAHKKNTSNGFFRQVHELVAHIPAGKIMTYGQIGQALASPYSARVVGFAMNNAPEGLPCHRVVNRLGEMAPGLIFGGPEIQRERLIQEGVPFLPNGNIDIKQARFYPDDAIIDAIIDASLGL